eukprot:scaffold31559_cov32-Tisochrysis_lutea.AAC.1
MVNLCTRGRAARGVVGSEPQHLRCTRAATRPPVPQVLPKRSSAVQDPQHRRPPSLARARACVRSVAPPLLASCVLLTLSSSSKRAAMARRCLRCVSSPNTRKYVGGISLANHGASRASALLCDASSCARSRAVSGFTAVVRRR